MTNWFLWLELLSTLGTTIANANGENVDKEKRYLGMLARGMQEKTLTDEKLLELRTRIKEEKLSGKVPTPDELDEFAERLAMRSEEIQEAGK